MKKPKIVLIAALSEHSRVIGANNKLLWRLPSDMARFVTLTTGHSVIMGRKTWESIPKKFRPLPNRTNIVLTHNHDFIAEGAQVAFNKKDALIAASLAEGNDTVYVIGGEKVYRAFLDEAEVLALTLVESGVQGDAFFPEYRAKFPVSHELETKEENGIRYRFVNFSKT